MAVWRVRGVLAVAGAAAVLAGAMGGCGNPEIVTSDGDGGGSASGGTAGIGGGPDGGINLDSGTGGSDGGVTPCLNTTCTPGQRCELVDGGGVCIDNTCADLTCQPTEKCEPHPQGGHVCVDNTCNGDVDCPPGEFCNGTTCEPDICDPGKTKCSGQDLLECSSNGGQNPTKYTCGSPAYFTSQCQDSGNGDAHCPCEDDWDCPAFTVCEVNRCVGTGVAPTCTLPPVPFADVPPAVEIHWGGDSRAMDEAHDGTPAKTPSPWKDFSHVVNTPIVANLDDDNGDGLINELDFPEIVFAAHQGNNPWANAVVRAIHGGGPDKGKDYFAVCGGKLWTSAAPTTATCGSSEPDADAGAPVAVADLDYDGVPEIIVNIEGDKFRILDNTGKAIYTLSEAWSPTGEIGETIAVANLDFKDNAEIIVGRNVYVLGKDSGGKLTVTHILQGDKGVGENQISMMACPADIVKAQPGQEIAVGATLYRLPNSLPTCGSPPCKGSLTVVWNAPDVAGNSGISGEGFCAVADVWGANAAASPGPSNPPDGKPEVILIDNGDLTILDGETGKVIDDRNLGGGARGGAPNVDDFDGDGFMEIASALQDFYIVVDLQDSTGSGGACPAWPLVIERVEQPNGSHNKNTPRNPGGSCTQDSQCAASAVCNKAIGQCVCLHNGWKRDSDDDSSRATSSSVFDFNGDGAAEVIYNDECEFRVYDGVNGNVFYSEVSRSRTGIENPVVADVDNDGNAEVVTAMNTAQTNRCDDDPGGIPQGPNGIRVWGDPKDLWVSARRIWNQQSYHVTNVTESGMVPVHPPESWGSFNGRVYNTYRSQPRNFGVAPDLTVVAGGVSSPDAQCGALGTKLDIAFEIKNDGDLRVGPGVEVTFEGTWGATTQQLLNGSGQPLTVTLTNSLEPGASVILSVGYDPANNGQTVLPDKVKVIVDAADAERECDETNNEKEQPVAAGQPRPDLRLELGLATPACPNANVAVTLFNDGTAPASNILIRYFAGDPSQGGQALQDQTVAGPLNAGQSTSFMATITSFPSNRNIVLFGVVDPDDTIDECNEANNKDAADNSVACNTGPK